MFKLLAEVMYAMHLLFNEKTWVTIITLFQINIFYGHSAFRISQNYYLKVFGTKVLILTFRRKQI